MHPPSLFKVANDILIVVTFPCSVMAGHESNKNTCIICNIVLGPGNVVAIRIASTRLPLDWVGQKLGDWVLGLAV